MANRKKFSAGEIYANERMFVVVCISVFRLRIRKIDLVAEMKQTGTAFLEGELMPGGALFIYLT